MVNSSGVVLLFICLTPSLASLTVGSRAPLGVRHSEHLWCLIQNDILLGIQADTHLIYFLNLQIFSEFRYFSWRAHPLMLHECSMDAPCQLKI
jgi:hypothetical protein